MGRKLHVDMNDSSTPELHTTQAACDPSHALLERVALAFDDDSNAHEMVQLITDVNDWIAAQPDADVANSYKALRAARDGLCSYRSSADAADDLAMLRAVENSLRMQLQEEQEAMAKTHDQLRKEIQAVRDELRAERERFKTELLAEQDSSLIARQDLRNSLRIAASNMQVLRDEVKQLQSQAQSHPVLEHGQFELKYPQLSSNAQNTLSVLNSEHETEALKQDALSTFFYLEMNNAPSSPTGPPPVPQKSSTQFHPYVRAQSVENLHDRRKASNNPFLHSRAISDSRVVSGAQAAYGPNNFTSRHDEGTKPQVPIRPASMITGPPSRTGSFDAIGLYANYPKGSDLNLPATDSSSHRRIHKMISSPLIRTNVERRSPVTSGPSPYQAGHTARLQKPHEEQAFTSLAESLDAVWGDSQAQTGSADQSTIPPKKKRLAWMNKLF